MLVWASKHSWNVMHVIHMPPGTEGRIPDAYESTYQQFKFYRAEVIEAALFIEARLKVLLSLLYAGTDERQIQLFRSSVLDPESCTFMHKWKMLHEAIEQLGMPRDCLNEKARKALFADLQRLIDDRNKFAHGSLYIDGRSGKPLLQYFQKGKRQEEHLHDDEIAAILARASDVAMLLDTMVHSIDPSR
jgi:hypothetical protein